MWSYRTNYRIIIVIALLSLCAGSTMESTARTWLILASSLFIPLNVYGLLQVSRVIDEKDRKIKEMDAATRNKDLLYSLVIHDLKGPANNISLLCEMMNRDLAGKDQKQLAKLIHASAAKHFALVNKLLEWTKTEVKAANITESGCDLAETVKEICRSNKTRCESKEILLMNYVDKPVHINTQRSVVETVIGNILDNAIKYTPGGGVITIASKSEPGGISVSITDTGLGMPNEAIQQVFTAGPRYVKAGTMKEQGSGIGLYLCNELVKNAGGTISAKSDPGKGSTFMFFLPNTTKARKIASPVTARMFL